MLNNVMHKLLDIDSEDVRRKGFWSYADNEDVNPNVSINMPVTAAHCLYNKINMALKW